MTLVSSFHSLEYTKTYGIPCIYQGGKKKCRLSTHSQPEWLEMCFFKACMHTLYDATPTVSKIFAKSTLCLGV